MISTISYTLGINFPDVKIYTEQVDQMERPAFFIRVLEANQDRHIGNLYTKLCSFVIRYHPDSGTSSDYRGLDEVADRLYAVLEFMEYEGKILRGGEMKHRIEENTLQFFVTCKQNLKCPVNDPLMEELETSLHEKG